MNWPTPELGGFIEDPAASWGPGYVNCVNGYQWQVPNFYGQACVPGWPLIGYGSGNVVPQGPDAYSPSQNF